MSEIDDSARHSNHGYCAAMKEFCKKDTAAVDMSGPKAPS
jgi:hypothetical protein